MYKVALEYFLWLPDTDNGVCFDRDVAGGGFFVFVFVCKHLIDIATGVSGDNLAIYIGWMVGCLVLQLVLSAARSCLTSRMEIALRNELHRKLLCI